MRSEYLIEGKARATLRCITHDKWTLVNIRVRPSERGKGVGTVLLGQIISDAEEEGVILFLEVFTSGPMTNGELQSWYRRHGFRLCRGGEMRRFPKTVREARARFVGGTRRGGEPPIHGKTPQASSTNHGTLL